MSSSTSSRKPTPPSSASNDKQIKSEFVPESHIFSKIKNKAIIQDTPGLVTTALYAGYPFIIILDKGLSLITWTNENQYHNFITVAVYITILRNWNLISHFIIPILVALSLCCGYWLVSTIQVDLDSNQEYKPTLEEILDRLENMNTRFNFLVSRFPKFDKKRLNRLMTSMLLLTPFYIILMRQLFDEMKVLMVFGTLILTWNSTWMMVIHRLIWRSSYVRQLAMFITGFEFSLEVKSMDLDHQLPHNINYKVSKQTTASTGEINMILEFDIYEHQRRWAGIGWSKLLLPLERSTYTNVTLEKCCDSLENFQFPKMFEEQPSRKCKWKWLDSQWKPANQYTGPAQFHTDSDGWIFYKNNWTDPIYNDSVTRFTRSRKLIRRAILVVSP